MEKKTIYVESYTRRNREPTELRMNARKAAKARWEKYNMRVKFLRSQGHTEESSKEIAKKEMYFVR